MSYIQVYVPNEHAHRLRPPVKHREAEKWMQLYHYEKRRMTPLFPDQIVNELTATSEYKRNTFYKIPSMSSNDPIWNYYRILKDHPSPIVGMEVISREKNKIKVKKPKANKKHARQVTIRHTPVTVSFD